jgi:hypothetical protein
LLCNVFDEVSAGDALRLPIGDFEEGKRVVVGEQFVLRRELFPFLRTPKDL